MELRPPFDHELAAALDARRAEVVVTLHPEEIGELRLRAAGPDDVAAASAGFRTTVHRAPGPPGGPDVEVVLLRPTGAGGPVPCLLHLHGGGLVTGSAWDDVVPLLDLARALGCAVASVGYRLAPEHPYPAALEDAYAALTWVVGEAEALGIRADRVVAEGISAGGGLAAALALACRDRGGPRLAGQVLLCPMLDDRDDTASGRQMAGHGAWDRTANVTAWRAYLGGSAGAADVPAHAAPARATDLSGLPPAFVDVGSAETFRDEAVAYATRLWLSGGDAELHVWPGGFHGFDLVAPEAAISRDARSAREHWLRRLFGRPEPEDGR